MGEQVQSSGVAEMGKKRGEGMGGFGVLGPAQLGLVCLSLILGYSPGFQRLNRLLRQVDAFL